MTISAPTDAEVVQMAATQYEESAARYRREPLSSWTATAEAHDKLATRCREIAARLRALDGK